MVARLPKREATYADLAALPEHLVGEIIGGELVVSPRPAVPHAAASSAAGAALFGPFHLKPGGPRGPGGWWILDEPELHLGRDVVVPDLGGWRRERVPVRPSGARIDLVPDWVCEVVSPSTGRIDRIQKARIYLEAGVAWFWLVDPLQQAVEVLQAEAGRWIVAGTWGGDDAEARMPPFDAVPLDLARWWEDGSESGEAP